MQEVASVEAAKARASLDEISVAMKLHLEDSKLPLYFFLASIQKPLV